jgi:dienelactone hydrolase
VPASAQVLILPDIRGLHQFYKDLALRFAEIGIAAIAMDYFGRTAGMARDFGNGTLLDQAGSIRTPALGLFGGADQGIPAEQVEEFDRRLDATGVAHEMVIY